MLHNTESPLWWAAFLVFVVFMLALDIGVLHRRPHAVRIGEALGASVMWIALAFGFAVIIYTELGRQKALEFVAGYLIEKALSVDNIFVFLVIFSYFQVPRAYRHRLLIWGVLGAIVLRVIFILAGAALLARFHWVTYVFGAFLIITGVKMLMHSEEHVHPERNPALRLFRRALPVTSDDHGCALFARQSGRLMVTPLMLVLLTVEATDVMFAVDSIPAVFAVTRDPFIVFTSNIFAILGLRALFFLLSGVMDRFHYLKYALGIILSAVGVKMLLVALGVVVPIGLSLLLIVSVLAASIALSLCFPPSGASRGAAPDREPVAR